MGGEARVTTFFLKMELVFLWAEFAKRLVC